MRRFGDRHWLYLTRRALALATLTLALTASTAAATDRYAVPTGGQTSGACATLNPCDLEYALEGAAGSGDIVYVAEGTYPISSPIAAGNGIQVRGQGTGLPRLVGDPGLGGPTLTVSGGAGVRHLRIEGSSSYVALDLTGAGQELEVLSSAANGMALRGDGNLNTVLVRTSSPGATALTIFGGLLNTSTIRHSTIVATGSGSTGLDASGLLSSPVVSTSIVSGTGTDVAGALLNPVSLSGSAYRTLNSAGVTDAGANLNTAAIFEDPAGGDFQQDSSSPTVNAGSNADGATYDLGGRPRTIGEGTDIGAYELPIPPTATTGAASLVTGTSARVAATINPRATATDYAIEYGTSSPPGTPTAGTSLGSGTTPLARTNDLTGLTPATRYYYRVVATSAWGTTYGSILTFDTPAVAATPIADAVSSLTPTSVRLNGRVNPGGAATSARFEWGTTTSYGNVTTAQSMGSGTSTTALAGETLTGLAPNTTYYYRVSATSSLGTQVSAGGSFTTPVALPGVATDRATTVTKTTARLLGAINPGGAGTTWSFEYGRTTAYGNKTADVTGAAGSADQSVLADVEGLEPGTTYHFRLVAQNAAGLTLGDDAVFTTAAPDPTPDPGPGATGPAPGDGGGDDEDAADVDAPVDPVPTDDTASGARQADGLPAPDATPDAGRSANAAPAGGTVRVRVPGADGYVTLTQGAGIPVGSLVDATNGQVTITSAADTRGHTQTANFSGSEFKLLQKRAAKPITDIVLTGGNFDGCSPRVLPRNATDLFAARRKWSRRRLWGNGHGRFRTRGRNGTATVRGTHWLTEDTCDGTLVRVRRGLVAVRDLGRRKTVMVAAGEQYLAKSPLAKKARRKHP